ncbi:zf-HC2 domain-containing protein [Acidobacteriota bacterium]
MRCQTHREKFTDYLTGEMDDAQKDKVQVHLAECPECRKELESLTEIWTKLGVLQEELPSPQMRSRFYSMLEEYKEKEAEVTFKERFSQWAKGLWPKKPAMQAALSFGLLFFGIIIGNFFHFTPFRESEATVLRREVQSMRQTLAVSLMEQSSPTERLRGINLSYGMDTPDQKLLDKLLTTLNTDRSISVRLAAIDALYLFAEIPAVKDGIITSLSQQTSPMVQASLIDLMVSIREKRAVQALKNLMLMENVEEDIKSRAEIGIKQLSF